MIAFDVLFEIAWKSTVILAAAFVTTGLLKGHSAAIRHLIWSCTLVALLVTPAIIVSGPDWRVPLLKESAGTDSPTAVLLQLPQAGVPMTVDQATLPGPSETFGASRAALMLVVLWAVGFVVLSTRFLTGLIWAQRVFRQAQPVNAAFWSAIIEEAAQMLRASQPIEVFKSDRISVAATYGILRPKILLPADADEWSRERARMVLLHELGHIRRRDCLTQTLGQLCWFLHWYNPLAYAAVVTMRAEQERASDDLVISAGIRARDYATELLGMARAFRRHSLPAWTIVSMAQPSRFAQRIAAILDPDRNRRTPTFRLCASVVLLTCLGVLPLGLVQLVASTVSGPSVIPMPSPLHAGTNPASELEPVPAESESGASPGLQVTVSALPSPIESPLSSATRPQETVFRKWFDEDVVYITTDVERQLFTALSTSQEREQFITQFWLRRDPTPGTVENEFKETHYTRIAMSNARFTWERPGWLSDRGHVLIRFGAPDTIESHPATATTFPYEVWTYRYIEGFGRNVRLEFIDPSRTREYRLTLTPGERRTLFGVALQ